MSDFVAVLKRTIEGLGETTPEMRQRVYDKARKTISAKLEAMNPPPSALVVGRQRRALEDAITEVESGFRKSDPKPPEPLDELEQVLNSLNGLKNQPVIPPKPPVSARAPEPAVPVTPRPVTTPVARPAAPQPSVSTRPQPVPPPAPIRETKQPEPRFDQDDGFDDDFSEPNDIVAHERPAPITEPVDSVDRNRNGRFGKIGIAAVLLAAIGVGAYAGWTNRTQLTEMVSSFTGSDPVVETPAPTPAQPEAPATDVAATPQPETPAPAEPPATTVPAQTGPVKFTQRLNADGTEADAGPADGGASVGEGTSVAAATEGGATPPATETPATPPPVAETPAPETPAPETPAPAEGTTPPADAAVVPAPTPAAETPAPADPAAPAAQPAAVAVAQKAIFYEERTNNVEGSAETGNVVWSVVQESPGADQPPEPAIRAEATIPSKDIQLRMTIRRNADKTLPASHIVEMIFLTPPGVEGGGVANVLRVALKGSEQDPGTPLAGIPAKISDGFFLVALNDTAADIANNTGLLRQRSWIDVPLVYASGRRALITMEKGIPGEKVFEDVLKAWGVPTSG